MFVARFNPDIKSLNYFECEGANGKTVYTNTTRTKKQYNFDKENFQTLLIETATHSSGHNPETIGHTPVDRSYSGYAHYTSLHHSCQVGNTLSPSLFNLYRQSKRTTSKKARGELTFHAACFCIVLYEMIMDTIHRPIIHILYPIIRSGSPGPEL